MSKSNSVLAKRYAKALFELALDSKCQEKVSTSFDEILKLISNSPDLVKFMSSPVIKREKQVQIMQSILKKAGADELVQKFVSVLASKGRLGILSQVISEFRSLLNEHSGKVEAEIVSAVELQSAQIAEIEKSLGSFLGKQVSVKVNVDEEIIGGVVVKLGSKMLDGSVAGKLEQLRILSKKAIANI